MKKGLGDPLMSDLSQSGNINQTFIEVKTVELQPISVNQKEAWFKLGKTLLVLRKKKDSWTLFKINENNRPEGFTFQSGCKDVLVDGIDVCPQINEIVNKWETFVEEKEIIMRAEATRLLNNEFVPRPPNEWEIITNALMKLLLERKTVKHFVMRSGGNEIPLGLYCYENGYYRECEEELRHTLSKVVEGNQLLEERLISQVIGEVIRRIEIKTYTEFKPMKHCLLFKNKVFSWDLFLQTKDLEKSVIDPNPDLIITHRIPWEIKPELYKVNREGILKYIPPNNTSDLIEVFRNIAPKSFKAFMDWVKEPHESELDALPKVALLLEIIGYTLYPHEYPFHKAVLLVGEGQNGKSTYIRLIETIIGRENVSAISLQDLDPNVNRFASAGLWGKLANLSTEPSRMKFDATTFKKATGEDPMAFERKFRDPITDFNYAKMIFSANELPKPPEDVYAFWRRWIVIKFPNKFPVDPSWFENTFTPEEIEGIIICSLHAFRLALERKGFTEQGLKDPREEWMTRSNAVYKYVKLMAEAGLIEIREDGEVSRDTLYELYLKLSKNEGDDPVAKKTFTEELQRLFNVKLERKRVKSSKREWCYVGIALSEGEKLKQALETLGLEETGEGV